ncbi:MAG: hypothetical protein HRU15_11155 [Planctomycetes bacterium]|nr:hypothetical protein [Planctomycetota bacterium]
MWRWIPSVLLCIGGLVALGFGVYIELEVQYEIGNWERTANFLYHDEIEGYRSQVEKCWTYGPLALLFAFLVRPGAWGQKRVVEED